MGAAQRKNRGFGSQQSPLPRKLIAFTLQNHPWAIPDPHFGVMPGAADGWGIDGRFAVLFHTTTEANATAIMRNGFKPSPVLEVGGFRAIGGPSGRLMPPGIWTSIRPTIPNDSDIWMPNVCSQSWVVLQVMVPMSIVSRRCIFEHTWPVAQFCLQPADVLGVTTLPPSQMPLLIHPETVLNLASFRRDYHHSSPYLDAINAAAAIEASQGVS